MPAEKAVGCSFKKKEWQDKTYIIPEMKASALSLWIHQL